ncbi:transglycosylase domain-containing protein [Metapseudomonas otitidis]|uniref:transglycosylase domain-containing protein n=1 Tax=Metapseudomonas otitidis TaxID=319939 RepID=UPI0013F64A97|nr:transglycosylase domain-containing protein [Pseudomonas otitidis]
MQTQTYTPASIARAFTRWLFRLLLVLLLIPVGAYLVFVVIRFLPAKSELDASLVSYQGPTPHLQMLRGLVWANVQGNPARPTPLHWLDGPDARITGQIARFITAKEDHYRSSLWRHLDGIAWQLSLNISYEHEAMAALWSAQVISPAGTGMEAAALHYFERPLRELGCHDLAALVVMVRAPRHFVPGSEASERFIRWAGLEAACGQPITNSADAS